MSTRPISARCTTSSLFALLAMTSALVLLLSACGRTELPDDGPPPAVSQEAAARFIRKALTAAQTGASTGQFTLTITDEEATSVLALGPQLGEQMESIKSARSIEDLQRIEGFQDLSSSADLEQWQQLVQSQEGIPDLALPDLRLAIEEPLVYFRGNGQIVIRGFGELGERRQPVRAVIAPRTEDGELVLDFVEGQLGPVPLPEPLFDLIGNAVSRTLLFGQDLARIQQVEVEEGNLTISGQASLLRQ